MVRTLPSIGIATALVAAMVLTAPDSATAADKQSVTLIDLSMDNAASKEIAHDIARALRRDPKLNYNSVNETLNTGGEDIERTNLRSAKSLYRSAMSRMRDKDYEEAAEEFDSAVASWLGAFGHTTDHQRIAHTMVMHGVALQLSKDSKGARKAWMRAVQFRPKYKPDLSAYKTHVAKAYEKARDKVILRDSVTFEVQTKPPHAEVWSNGRYFGLSPAFVRGFKGQQFIAVRKHGYARISKVATIKKNDAVVSLVLKEARKRSVFDKLRESLAEVFDGAVERNDLSEARGLFNAGMAVIMRATGTRERMTIQVALANLDGRQVVNRVTRKMPWLRRNKKAMEKLVADLFKAPKIPVGAKGPIVKHDTVFTKWWFWTGAAAVVGGSVAAYFLLRDDQTADVKYKPGEGGIAIQF